MRGGLVTMPMPIFANLTPVVQMLDSAIHWITQLVLLVFIRWIVIHPVDSTIHCLNNWGLNGNVQSVQELTPQQ